MKEVLLSVKAVKSMHCLHLWALTLGQALVSVHLAIGNVTLYFYSTTFHGEVLEFLLHHTYWINLVTERFWIVNTNFTNK